MPIPLRIDIDTAAMHALARKTKDCPRAQRLFALAVVKDKAARIVRGWVAGLDPYGT